MNPVNKHHINNLLLHQYQNGEGKALEVLIKRFHPVMVRTIRHYTANCESVDDIAQDCWYAIIPQLPELQLKISFDAWALTIARRKSIDWIRMQQKSRIRVSRIQDSAETVSESESDSESEFESEPDRSEPDDNRNLMERVLAGFRQLSPTRRIVLHLFYLENLSLQEISELLDISTGTVKSRLFYARESLKQIIKNKHGDTL